MNRIPGGVQTYSKANYGPGGPGKSICAQGAYVEDESGKRWIDYVAGLGPVILGHQDPDVDDAVRRQVGRGICFPTACALEEEVAELIAQMVPGAEMARFGKNGADACAAAVRLARAITGRDRIVSAGYHGYQDWTLGPPALGVPRVVWAQRTDVPYGDGERLADAMLVPACLIIEPVATSAFVERPPDGYLEACRELCDRSGALLIYDEVVTGFRVALGGAQEAWKAPAPDLICLGKAMGNGYPIAAVVGRREIMDPHALVVSSTFGGEGVGLAAAKAVLEIYRREPVVEHLWRVGGEFARRTTESAWGLPFVVDGFACKPRLRCTDADPERARLLMSLVLQQAAARGVLLHLSGENVSFAHGEAELYETAVALRDTFALGREALADGNLRERLVGEPYVEGFRAITEEGHGGPR